MGNKASKQHSAPDEDREAEAHKRWEAELHQKIIQTQAEVSRQRREVNARIEENAARVFDGNGKKAKQQMKEWRDKFFGLKIRDAEGPYPFDHWWDPIAPVVREYVVAQEDAMTDVLNLYSTKHLFRREQEAKWLTEWKKEFTDYFQLPRPEWGRPPPKVFTVRRADDKVDVLQDGFKSKWLAADVVLGHGAGGTVVDCWELTEEEQKQRQQNPDDFDRNIAPRLVVARKQGPVEFVVKRMNKRELLKVRHQDVKVDMRSLPEYGVHVDADDVKDADEAARQKRMAEKQEKALRRAAGVYSHVRFEVEWLFHIRSEAASKMHHFLEVHAAFEDDDMVYLVTRKYYKTLTDAMIEFEEDPEVRQVNGPAPKVYAIAPDHPRLLRIVHELLFIVALLQQNRVVHGDLKPGNLMVTGPIKDPTSRVVVIDMGSAVKHWQGGAYSQNPGTFTDWYVAPEVADPHYYKDEGIDIHRITYAADVYTMGKILERLLYYVFGVGPKEKPAVWDHVAAEIQNRNLFNLVTNMRNHLTQPSLRPNILTELQDGFDGWLPIVTQKHIEEGKMPKFGTPGWTYTKTAGFGAGYAGQGTAFSGSQREDYAVGDSVPRVLRGEESVPYLAFLHRQNKELRRENKHLKKKLAAVARYVNEADARC